MKIITKILFCILMTFPLLISGGQSVEAASTTSTGDSELYWPYVWDSSHTGGYQQGDYVVKDDIWYEAEVWVASTVDPANGYPWKEIEKPTGKIIEPVMDPSSIPASEWWDPSIAYPTPETEVFWKPDDKVTGYWFENQWYLNPGAEPGKNDGWVLIDHALAPSLVPASAEYDLNPDSVNHDEISVTMTLEPGITLLSIENGSTTLVEGTDYTLNANNVVTFPTTYLDTLPVGVTELVFSISNGSELTFTINVTDSGIAFVIDLGNPAAPVPGVTYDEVANTLTFQPGSEVNNYTIIGSSSTRIIIPDGVGTLSNPLQLTLNGVTMSSSKSPIALQGTSVVDLNLAAGTTNNITCTNYSLLEPAIAGINVPTNATLTIGGTGSLNATGGTYGAGIGSGYSEDAGTIIINDGTVTAQGKGGGAGIGGGFYGSVNTVTINGGTVTAIGGSMGAGIGTGGAGIGSQLSSGTVTINGGTVTASGGQYAAGIGTGSADAGGELSAGTVTINGGIVTASGGPSGGAGIGTGEALEGSVVPGNVSISNNAEVTAVSAGTKPAIEDADGMNTGTAPANIVSVALNEALSTTSETMLKLSDENGVPLTGAGQVSEIKVPASYKNITFTTGSYAREVNVDAYTADGVTFLGAIVKASDAMNVTSGSSFIPVSVVLE